MQITLPHSPKWSKTWIEKKLSVHYFKKPYDRFMWWRSYTPKNKPLSSRHPFRDRKLQDLRNGFIKEFKMDKEEYDSEVLNTSGTTIEFYYSMDDKYGKRIRLSRSKT